MRRSLSLAFAVGAASVILLSASLPTLAGSRTYLSGSIAPWAKAANRVGTADSSFSVDFRVYLPWRNSDQAAAYAKAVATKGSGKYGKFLSPAAFRSLYSPGNSAVSAVKQWLVNRGFSIGHVPANQHYVEATGTLSQAASAFHTTFSIYKYKGQKMRSNDTLLSVPSGLPAIEAVIGLDESANLVRVDASAPGGFRNAQPCSDYWGQKTVNNTATLDGTDLPNSPNYAFAPCGYLPAQLQGAYGMADAIAGGNDGSGVTVAIIDAYASRYVRSDLSEYSSRHGLPTNFSLRQVVAPGTFRRPENPAQDPQGWAGEETLDLEAVHTMAPGANLVYVGAPNNYRDLDSAMNHVVDMHLADIVTNSYGYATEALPPGFIKPDEDMFIQAAAEGISVLFSSGDNGDETSRFGLANPTPDWPASSPWVTAVGGTSLGVTASNGYLFETGWATERELLVNGEWAAPTYLYAAGGGTSRLFRQPSYQAGVVPTSISETYGGSAMRAVPDVAALGDPNTGMRIGITQRFPDGTYYDEYRIGGTSLASPLMAGMLALAVQNHGNFGLANPALYAAAGTSAYHDVTKAPLSSYPGDVRADYINGVDDTDGYKYSVRLFDQDQIMTIHVRTGYDDITGIGTPNGQAWLDSLQ
jgi:subtilase family serine protease